MITSFLLVWTRFVASWAQSFVPDVSNIGSEVAELGQKEVPFHNPSFKSITGDLLTWSWCFPRQHSHLHVKNAPCGQSWRFLDREWIQCCLIWGCLLLYCCLSAPGIEPRAPVFQANNSCVRSLAHMR